jgi:hypothetical protein
VQSVSVTFRPRLPTIITRAYMIGRMVLLPASQFNACAC